MACEAAWIVRLVASSNSVKFQSPRFEHLFGTSEDTPDSPMITSRDCQLLSLVEGLGMPQAELRKRLDYLEAYAALEQGDILRERPLAKVGCYLQLARKKTGGVFVSQVTSFTFEGNIGEVYSVSIHDDVTGMCSVKHLVEISGTGAYFLLLRTLRDHVRSPEGVQRVRQLQAQLQELMGETKGLPRVDLGGISAGRMTGIHLPSPRRIASRPPFLGQAKKDGLP